MARLALFALFLLFFGCAKDIDEIPLFLSEKTAISDQIRVTIKPNAILNNSIIRFQVMIETTQVLDFFDQDLIDISFITLNDDIVIEPSKKTVIEQTTYQSKSNLFFTVSDTSINVLEDITQIEFTLFTPSESTFNWQLAKIKTSEDKKSAD